MHRGKRAAAFVGGLAVALGLVGPAPAAAFETNVTRVPRVASATNSAGTTRPCITCHNNADGGSGCVASGGAAPCLNPFGSDFLGNRLFWDGTLAGMDSDGDGFTNGQELQDPAGSWVPGDPNPGVESCVTRPGDRLFTPGDEDDDGDGYCCFGEDLDGNGDCTGSGENTGALDCNETNAAVNSGATELCSNLIDDDCNGLDTLSDPVCEDVVDRDGDGYCVMGIDLNGDADCIDAGEVTADVDCDDTEITVSPGASENCFDELDNDCDESVDLADADCRNDVDNDDDGFCPIGADLNDDGDCLDAGELEAGSDCDDREPLANSAQTEICTDSIDNDCDGRADFTDTECSGFFDGDEDGFCPLGTDLNGDGDCIDEGEDTPLGDCNDLDPVVRPSAIEACNDRVDTDCDGLVSLEDPDCAGFLDTDGDQYCLQGETGGAGGFDINGDGDCVDRDEEGGAGDCNDTNAAVNAAATELCFDGLDNDCDGSTDAGDSLCRDEYFDHDGDGWCDVGPDLNGDLDCSDEGEQVGPGDVPPARFDPTRYPGAPENCLDRKDNDLNGVIDDPDLCVRTIDADGDGWCPLGDDLNGDGDCTDPDERSGEGDCDDGDPEVNPRVVEDCFNRRDDNCDGDVDLFDVECFHLQDRDGDGFCPMGTDDNRDGDCLDFGEDRFGEDCDDTNANVGPRGVEDCADGIDNDCDTFVDFLDTQCDCSALCDDGDPCTIDDCTGPATCSNTPDPGCGMGMDMGPGMDGGPGLDIGAPSDGGCGAGGGAAGALVALFMVAVGRRREDER